MPNDSISFQTDIKQLILQKLKICNTKSIPTHLIQHANLESIIDSFSHDLIFGLTVYMSGNKWSETTKVVTKPVSYPKTWVNAFRLRFIPNLLIGKFPIQYTVVEVVHKSVVNNTWVFPEIPPNPNPDVTDFVVNYYHRNSVKSGKEFYNYTGREY